MRREWDEGCVSVATWSFHDHGQHRNIKQESKGEMAESQPCGIKKTMKKMSQIKVARACWETLMHTLDILDMN